MLHRFSGSIMLCNVFKTKIIKKIRIWKIFIKKKSKKKKNINVTLSAKKQPYARGA